MLKGRWANVFGCWVWGAQVVTTADTQRSSFRAVADCTWQSRDNTKNPITGVRAGFEWHTHTNLAVDSKISTKKATFFNETPFNQQFPMQGNDNSGIKMNSQLNYCNRLAKSYENAASTRKSQTRRFLFLNRMRLKNIESLSPPPPSIFGSVKTCFTKKPSIGICRINRPTYTGTQPCVYWLECLRLLRSIALVNFTHKRYVCAREAIFIIVRIMYRHQGTITFKLYCFSYSSNVA